MAITTLDGALAGMQALQFFFKATSPTLITGRPHSFWYLNGIPGPGSSDKTTGTGVALVAPQAGQIPFTNPGSGTSYLSLVRGFSAGQPGTLMLCDRMVVCGAPSTGGSAIPITGTTTTLNTLQLPDRDAGGGHTGLGVFAALEVETVTGSGTPVLSINYTNSAGVAGQTGSGLISTASASPQGAFYPFSLAAGDLGVRSIQSLSLSATWSSGNIVLVLYRILAVIECPLANTPASPLTLASGGFPQMFNGSVPFLVFIPSSTTGTNIRGMIGVTQG